MKHLGWLVCRTFIEKRKKESKSILFSFLSPEQKEKISHLQPPSQDLSLGFDLKTHLFQWIHHSWLLPFLRGFSEKEICLFLSSIDEQKALKLKESLKVTKPLRSLPQISRRFFENKIIDYLLSQHPDLLPIEALPRSPLNVLLQLSSEHLTFVIDLLGLHDLAVELKQIIDNNKLKKIYSIFPKEKEVFLKMLAHKKEPVMFRRIEISRWDGKAETLLTLLFQRGLNRLAKALYRENPDLIWYIKRRMSTEDAQIFTSLCKGLENPKAYSVLSTQVLEAITFLQKTTPSTML